jgi:hypothetical protein
MSLDESHMRDRKASMHQPFGPLKRLCCAACWLLAVAWAPLRADETTLPEQQIKAAYILNFARYASWPSPMLADARTPLVVCLIGQGAADIARQLQSRAAGNRPLELRMLARPEDADECHAIYIGPSERPRQGALLARLRDQAVLTIGDSASFLADGGMINMMLVEGTIRFEINLTAAKRSGMSLNPRVLALAERVVGGVPK